MPIDLLHLVLDTKVLKCIILNQKTKKSNCSKLILVTVPDPIYSKVELQEGNDLVLQVSKCWATPTPNKDDVNQYVFIDNFGVSPGEEEDVAIDVNCQGATAEFSFNSFAFVDLRPAG